MLVAEENIKSRMHSLSNSMSTMVVQGEGLNLQDFQGYEHGESSSSQRSQASLSNDQYRTNFQGGNGFSGVRNGTDSKDFQSSQRGSFNNKRFGGGNDNSSFSSGFNNRNGNNGYSGSGKSVAGHESVCNGFSSNKSSTGQGTHKSNWNGNTNSKYSVSPECQMGMVIPILSTENEGS